jgi:hypothetical protein
MSKPEPCQPDQAAAFEPSVPRPSDARRESIEPTPEKDEEIGGPQGPEPTRFGDWERKGRCIDF